MPLSVCLEKAKLGKAQNIRCKNLTLISPETGLTTYTLGNTAGWR